MEEGLDTSAPDQQAGRAVQALPVKATREAKDATTPGPMSQTFVQAEAEALAGLAVSLVVVRQEQVVPESLLA